MIKLGSLWFPTRHYNTSTVCLCSTYGISGSLLHTATPPETDPDQVRESLVPYYTLQHLNRPTLIKLGTRESLVPF